MTPFPALNVFAAGFASAMALVIFTERGLNAGGFICLVVAAVQIAWVWAIYSGK